MNYQKAILLIAVVLGSFIPTPLSAEPLKVVAWNIEWFPGGNPTPKNHEKKGQTKLIQKQLAAIQPDIFLAQEITDEAAFKNMVSSLPTQLTMHVCSRFVNYESNPLPPQQCAIASNLKADTAFFERFRPKKNIPHLGRGFSFAALEHPEGGLIMIYSVHLKSNRDSDSPKAAQNIADIRAESVRQILSHKKRMEKRYSNREIIGWIIGGDFNTNHDGQFRKCTAIADLTQEGFHNTWDKTPKKERYTWFPNKLTRKFKPTTFDYLMTFGFRKNQAQTISAPRAASDHDPVAILLEAE